MSQSKKDVYLHSIGVAPTEKIGIDSQSRFKNLVLLIVLPANFENPLIYLIAMNSPMYRMSNILSYKTDQGRKSAH